MSDCRYCKEGFPIKKYIDGRLLHFDGMMAWYSCENPLPQTNEPPATPTDWTTFYDAARAWLNMRRTPCEMPDIFNHRSKELAEEFQRVVARAAASQAALTGADEIVEECAQHYPVVYHVASGYKIVCECDWKSESQKDDNPEGLRNAWMGHILSFKGKFSLPPAALIEKLEGLEQEMQRRILYRRSIHTREANMISDSEEFWANKIADLLRSPATKAEASQADPTKPKPAEDPRK